MAVGKLVFAPGDAGEQTITLAHGVLDIVLDQDRDQSRHTMDDSQTRAAASAPHVIGSFAADLSDAEIVKFHSWMSDLVGGEELALYADSAAAVTATVKLRGDPIDEDHEWLGPQLWRVTLPVIEA
jgi:hypothetical protein